jgi:hypothetical protein
MNKLFLLQKAKSKSCSFYSAQASQRYETRVILIQHHETVDNTVVGIFWQYYRLKLYMPRIFSRKIPEISPLKVLAYHKISIPKETSKLPIKEKKLGVSQVEAFCSASFYLRN